MDIISPSIHIETPIHQDLIYANLERYGRTAYKSEDKITPDSSRKFLTFLIKRGHESVLEHESITVRIICDRGVTHELVRHRIGVAFTQESTRYCNYAGGKVRFIQPDFTLEEDDLALLEAIEAHYNKKIAQGKSPQQARYFLPNGLKTEIVVTANIREWRHILLLRTSPNAHPQMQEVMNMILAVFKMELPVLFGDNKKECEVL